MSQEFESQQRLADHALAPIDASAGAEYYSNSVEHILAELEWIDLLVQARVQSIREVQHTDREFQGLYISEAEVNALLAQPAGAPHWTNTKATTRSKGFDEASGCLRAGIDQCREESLRRGITLRLEKLARLFDLTPFDVAVVLICLAQELDLRYERLYAYLQDDVTKKRPSVDLVLNLLCRSVADKLLMRQRFNVTQPLFRHGLLHLVEDPTQVHPALLAQYLKLDERIVRYLLDSDVICDSLRGFSKVIVPQAELAAIHLEPETKARINAIIAYEKNTRQELIFYLEGPYGVGKRSVAEAICKQLGQRLLSVNGHRLLTFNDTEFESTLQRLIREAMLQEAALYIDSIDVMMSEGRDGASENDNRWRLLVNTLATWPGYIFLSGNAVWTHTDVLQERPMVRVEFPQPDDGRRVQLWNHALHGMTVDEDVDPEIIAGRFRFNGGQIKDAVAAATNLARWRNPRHVELDSNDLFAACRLQSNRKLSTLAQKIAPRYRWEDIVLPESRLQQLQEIHNAVLYRPLVYSKWGFDQKLSLGKGLSALFAGPSGTGKTMAAEIIAGELRLDVYKIDLSTVVSKYIGETEKNLSQIFAEAETANAILFFDEADALFGKRSDVHDAHDRYANIETGYLLQRMEAYEGVVILATNLSNNMDDAFVRRLHFSVEFPLPNAKDRLRIWQGVWPHETPLSPELNLNFMSRRFELSGGNIKNIALAAAFLAADDGGMVKMKHLMRATQREYQKMGKVVLEGEFSERDRPAAAR